MKTISISIVTIALVLVSCFSAFAGHFRGGFRGGPVWGPWWYGPSINFYPYYTEQPIIVQEPEVYVQPSIPQSAPQSGPAEYYWYYCKNPQGYYPYVKACPDGWMKVVPSPPQPSDTRK